MKRFALSAAMFFVALFGGLGCTTVLSQLEPARETICLQSAWISLQDAVAAAEARGGGAVDARSGDIATTGGKQKGGGRLSSAFWGLFERDPAESARIAPAVKLGLPDAIALAAQASGKVPKANLEWRDGVSGYAIKLVERGKVRMIWVDGNSDVTLLARSYDLDGTRGPKGFAGTTAIAFLLPENDDEAGIEGEFGVDDDEDTETTG